MKEETIVQVATATGGGVAIVRLSGPRAHAIGRELVGGEAPAPRALVPAIVRAAAGEVLDSGLYVEFVGPRSFTGEDVAEFQGHGGSIGVARIIARAVALGARPAEAGEFTLRAFLNGKIDLAQAEAVAESVAAKSEASHRLAQRQLSGELSERVAAIRGPLVEAASALAADIDFPDENIAMLSSEEVRALALRAREAIDVLLAGHAAGRRLREGAVVAIVGPPNAGKSSLLNALAGYERAIVSPLAGTTRDTVEVDVVLGGVAVRLVDTAGLRTTADVVEAAGMSRARSAAAAADLVLVVVSGDSDWTALPLDGNGRTLWLLNKIDCGPVSDALVAKARENRALAVSARTGAGLEVLREQLRLRLLGDASASVLLTLERHAALLREARDALTRADAALAVGAEVAAVEVGAAVQRLGEVLGEHGSADVLNEIFTRFCIGK